MGTGRGGFPGAPGAICPGPLGTCVCWEAGKQRKDETESKDKNRKEILQTDMAIQMGYYKRREILLANKHMRSHWSPYMHSEYYKREEINLPGVCLQATAPCDGIG